MNNAQVVKIAHAEHNLEDDELSHILMQGVVTLCEIVKQVFASHVLDDQVVVLARLKHVLQLDDVGMLAHFQHFDLFALLIDLNWLHIGFVDLLHSHEVLSLDVSSKLDYTKLAFA